VKDPNERVLGSVISTITMHTMSDEAVADDTHATQRSWVVGLQTRTDGVLYARIERENLSDSSPWFALTHLPYRFISASQHGVVHIFMHGRAWTFKLDDPAATQKIQSTNGLVRAPLGARVACVMVKQGDTVSAGQTLAVLEAMKWNMLYWLLLKAG